MLTFEAISMPRIRGRTPDFFTLGLITCVATLLLGCSATIGGPTDAGSKYRLTVLERSAATLRLQWDPIPNADGYTVDYLTGLTACNVQIPMHMNVLEVGNVTTVNVTGLLPSTDYHIHVHKLVGRAAQDLTTNSVFVRTLSPGSAAQPVAAADYQSC